jgi:hypothetical protein
MRTEKEIEEIYQKLKTFLKEMDQKDDTWIWTHEVYYGIAHALAWALGLVELVEMPWELKEEGNE